MVDLKAVEDFFKRAKKNPLRAFALAITCLAVMTLTAFAISWAEEKGKQQADPPPPPPQTSPSVDGIESARPITIEQILIGRLLRSNRLSLTVRNNTAQQIIVSEISLLGSTNPPAPCMSEFASSSTAAAASAHGQEGPGALEIGGQVDVVPAPFGFTLSGTYSLSNRPDVLYTLTGSIGDRASCEGGVALQFEMNTEITLQPRSVGSIILLLPKRLDASGPRRSTQPSYSLAARHFRTPGRIQTDIIGYSYLTATLRTTSDTISITRSREDGYRAPRAHLIDH